jgi:hypothetical protein
MRPCAGHAPIMWLREGDPAAISRPRIARPLHPYLCACGVVVWCTDAQRRRLARGLRLISN